VSNSATATSALDAVVPGRAGAGHLCRPPWPSTRLAKERAANPVVLQLYQGLRGYRRPSTRPSRIAGLATRAGSSVRLDGSSTAAGGRSLRSLSAHRPGTNHAINPHQRDPADPVGRPLLPVLAHAQMRTGVRPDLPPDRHAVLELLRWVDLYKVGHQGSRNATPRTPFNLWTEAATLDSA